MGRDCSGRWARRAAGDGGICGSIVTSSDGFVSQTTSRLSLFSLGNEWLAKTRALYRPDGMSDVLRIGNSPASHSPVPVFSSARVHLTSSSTPELVCTRSVLLQLPLYSPLGLSQHIAVKLVHDAEQVVAFAVRAAVARARPLQQGRRESERTGQALHGVPVCVELEGAGVLLWLTRAFPTSPPTPRLFSAFGSISPHRRRLRRCRRIDVKALRKQGSRGSRSADREAPGYYFGRKDAVSLRDPSCVCSRISRY